MLGERMQWVYEILFVLILESFLFEKIKIYYSGQRTP